VSAPLSSPRGDTLALYRRRWTAWFSLPFGIVMCLAGVWFLVVMLQTMRGGMGLAFGLFAMLFSSALGATLIKGALRALRATEPALLFDADGITHVADGTVFIPWDAVERISSNEGDGNDLGIWFKSGRQDGQGGGLGTVLRRVVVGADKTIPLGDLVYHPHQLAAAIARLHQAAQGRKGGEL
jgi:hypothetical protein